MVLGCARPGRAPVIDGVLSYPEGCLRHGLLAKEGTRGSIHDL